MSPMKWKETLTQLLAVCAVSVSLCSCRRGGQTRQPAPAPPASQSASQPATAALPASQPGASGWRSLFDGKTLTGWKVPEFGASGKVYVKDGAMQMEFGYGCTGVAYTGEVPRENYEVTLEGRRVEGMDFWCGLTFPVGKEHVTLVLGGWGGSVVGISCIDYMDAMDNETTTVISFDQGRWYRVRARVTSKLIQCWLDDEKIVEVERFGKVFGLRPEVDLCVPLGIATWETHGAVRDIRLRELDVEADE